MQDNYGNDSFAFLIDEGFSGLSNDYGAFVLSLGMAEKGSVDVGIRVENPGGHSSVPPVHTGSEFPSSPPKASASLDLTMRSRGDGQNH